MSPSLQTTSSSEPLQTVNRSRSDVDSMSKVATGAHPTISVAPIRATADLLTAEAFIRPWTRPEATVGKQLSYGIRTFISENRRRVALKTRVRSDRNAWRDHCCAQTRARVRVAVDV